MRRSLLSWLAIAGIIGGCGGCASAPKNHHVVSDLIPGTLRVRRPLSAGADPQAEPGSKDYQSAVLPNERWDCERAEDLFRNWNIPAIRSCLNSLGKSITVKYRLLRQARPEWDLEDVEKAPACIRASIPKIPVPREIVFQSTDEGNLNCYSARLDIEGDQVLHLKIPFKDREDLVVKFPLDQSLQDDDAVLRLLSAWSVSPLWPLGKEDGSFLPSTIVPDRTCRQCLGKENLVMPIPGLPPPNSWPSPGL